MTRVAALYDVHGNLPALEAVLAEVEEVGVDIVVSGGDVALGPMPRESIDALEALGERVRFVSGNTDRALVEMLEGVEQEGDDPLASEWVVERLRTEDRDALAGFAEHVVLDVTGLGRVRFCHGSPRSDIEILTRVTSDQRLATVLAGVTEDVVVCGHTHSQFDRPAGRIRVVNAGSVGMPYEERPGAYWALLGPEVELRRTEYDLDSAAVRIQAVSWPAAEWFVRENLLETPAPEETAAHFEQVALERDQAADA